MHLLITIGHLLSNQSPAYSRHPPLTTSRLLKFYALSKQTVDRLYMQWMVDRVHTYSMCIGSIDIDEGFSYR